MPDEAPSNASPFNIRNDGRKSLPLQFDLILADGKKVRSIPPKANLLIRHESVIANARELGILAKLGHIAATPEIPKAAIKAARQAPGIGAQIEALRAELRAEHKAARDALDATIVRLDSDNLELQKRILDLERKLVGAESLLSQKVADLDALVRKNATKAAEAVADGPPQKAKK